MNNEFGVFIVVDDEDNVCAEHFSLDAARDDARRASLECKVSFTVYQRITRYVSTAVVDEITG